MSSARFLRPEAVQMCVRLLPQQACTRTACTNNNTPTRASASKRIASRVHAPAATVPVRAPEARGHTSERPVASRQLCPPRASAPAAAPATCWGYRTSSQRWRSPMPPRPGSRGSLLLPDPADVAELFFLPRSRLFRDFWFLQEIFSLPQGSRAGPSPYSPSPKNARPGGDWPACGCDARLATQTVGAVSVMCGVACEREGIGAQFR